MSFLLQGGADVKGFSPTSLGRFHLLPNGDTQICHSSAPFAVEGSFYTHVLFLITPDFKLTYQGKSYQGKKSLKMLLLS